MTGATAGCRVVLVEPENPLNVGFVARAMRAFGVKDLRIISNRWKSTPPEAFVTGARASEILNGARIDGALAGALSGCRTAIAFSRRPTALRQQEFTLPRVPVLSGRVALVFGRESTGLTRAESALCPFLARIPCRDGVSLNLGQAVSVALFCLTAPSGAAAPPPETASLDRMLALWDYLEPRLAAAPRLSEVRLRRIRQMLYRLRLDDTDFNLLFSVMKTLALPAAARAVR